MSAQFIVTYDGRGVKFSATEFVFCDCAHATIFISEPDAYCAAYCADLEPDRVAVIPTDSAIRTLQSALP